MGHPVHTGLVYLETRTSNPPNPVSQLVNQPVTVFSHCPSNVCWLPPQQLWKLCFLQHVQPERVCWPREGRARLTQRENFLASRSNSETLCEAELLPLEEHTEGLPGHCREAGGRGWEASFLNSLPMLCDIPKGFKTQCGSLTFYVNYENFQYSHPKAIFMCSSFLSRLLHYVTWGR